MSGEVLSPLKVVLLTVGALVLVLLAVASFAGVARKMSLAEDIGRFEEARATRVGGNARKAGGKRRYKPYIRYRYVVGGKEYRGSMEVGGSMSKAKATAIVQREVRGPAIAVYYDPSDPQRHEMSREPPSRGKIVGQGTFGVAALVGAFYCVARLRRSFRARRSPSEPAVSRER